LSGSKLAKLQRKIRFSRAEDFLRIGEKAEALSMISQNLGGINSAQSFARMILRLLIPYPLVQWHRRRLQHRATKRYGSIQL
jgi:hypothetical protein